MTCSDTKTKGYVDADSMSLLCCYSRLNVNKQKNCGTRKAIMTHDISFI